VDIWFKTSSDIVNGKNTWLKILR